MDWGNLGYIVVFGAMAFMMFRGGGCCGGGHRGGHNDGRNGSHSGHGGCCGGGSVPEHQPRQTGNMAENATTTRFGVTGMTCQHCAGTIEKALLATAGVNGARVSLADKTAEVTFDPAVVTVEDLKRTVREAGYQPQ
ncbi:heavy-metal-associated domain-containing protein [Anaeroselena agilis]|uniref:Copper chaperone CopZ n=1 Tax=Anaeroselena agilis TaxID=3063788 RepID=A0ABU3NTW9_9FIRM|nr:heavy metal-associated domain-containing protein [Selenomonadales bacterium 4137-cl]